MAKVLMQFLCLGLILAGHEFAAGLPKPMLSQVPGEDERLRIDYDRAVAALRLQAQVERKDLNDLATSMVEAANRLNSFRR